MELLFGTHVRSGGRRIGSLAGLEVDSASRTVTKIIFSGDGKLGSHAQTRPLSAVKADGHALTVEGAAASITPAQPILWSRSIRIVRGGRESGRLAGVVLDDRGAVQAILARQHWWGRRTRIAAGELDVSTPGAIGVADTRSVAA